MMWRWPNFTATEMRCKGSLRLAMDPDFMDRLQALREAVGFPFIISSGYRSPEHDRAVGGSGVHPTGKAADIRVFGPRAFTLIGRAGEFGFTGLGVQQRGPFSKRFVHLDTLPAGGEGHPRPWIWSYK